MVGGAPVEMNGAEGESEWRTKMTRITIRTMHGNRRTTPSGIEMLELPRNRIRLFKKLTDFGEIFSADFDISSSLGMVGVEGKRFFTLCRRSMVDNGQSGQVDRNGLWPRIEGLWRSCWVSLLVGWALKIASNQARRRSEDTRNPPNRI